MPYFPIGIAYTLPQQAKVISCPQSRTMSPQSPIAHYRITSKLGEGGMGAVYRATDTKLNRDVAIKVLPDSFADDPERLARFQREAQVLASLNHPNIAAIYGVEDRAIVMELVEGPDLAGPLPVEEALPLLQQLIDALEYAHEKGVVHRDLKPLNIKITPEGRLKVLDFGLAKAFASEPAASDPLSSPTLTIGATKAGVIMGTAAYMAPEQARGQTVDKRADIWSFGAVAYEMLSGRQPFIGPTVSDTLAAVLKEEPDWNVIPVRMRRLVATCLVKDPHRRMRDIGDARLLVDEAPPPSRRTLLPWTLSSLTVAMAGLALWAWLRPTPAEAPKIMRLTIPIDAGQTGVTTPPRWVAMSPDASRVAFVAGPRSEICVRALDQFEAKLLPGTDGASFLRFSPDGQSIAYITGVFGLGPPIGAHLARVAVAGGPPMVLAEAQTGRGPPGVAWQDNRTILFISNGVLYRIPASGGKAEIFARPDASKGEGVYSTAQMLPDGRQLLVTLGGKTVALNLKTREKKVVLDRGYVEYVPPSPGSSIGHLVYYAGAEVMAVPFDYQSLEVKGSAVPVLNGVQVNVGPFGAFSFSDSGTVAYLPGASRGGLYTLVWVERSGRESTLSAPPRPYLYPRLSPDGERIAVETGESTDVTERTDIWVFDVVRGTLSRITSADYNFRPQWAPDGKRLYYASGAEPSRVAIISAPADGTSPPPAHPISELGPRRFPEAVSRDGKLLLGRNVGSGSGNDFWVLPITEGAAAFGPFLDTRFPKYGAQFSPDGHWVAYVSGESGTYQVYVTAYPGPGPTHPISTDGGILARWSATGNELFYLNGSKMMVAEIQTSPTFRAGIPTMLFENKDLMPARFNVAWFDVALDGKRFLMLKPDTALHAQSNQLNIVLNWSEELRRLAPGSGK